MDETLIIESIIIALKLVTPLFISANLYTIFSANNTIKNLSRYEGKLITNKSRYEGKLITNKSRLNEIIENKKFNQKLLPELEDIVNKLGEYTSEDNMTTAYKNLQTAKINRNILLILFGGAGVYNIVDNSIKYAFKYAKGHEFLHLASSLYDEENKIYYSGFSQAKDNASIGRGINEGYTELLASRIYNNNKVNAYRSEVKIAKLLEFFFDDPKMMEDFYFNHDLPGLVFHMEKYAKRDQIISLITDVDKDNLIRRTNPLFSYYNIKSELTLYNWFSSSNAPLEKKEQFKNLVCENKLCALIINKKKVKLERNSPYTLKNFSSNNVENNKTI